MHVPYGNDNTHLSLQVDWADHYHMPHHTVVRCHRKMRGELQTITCYYSKVLGTRCVYLTFNLCLFINKHLMRLPCKQVTLKQ